MSLVKRLGNDPAKCELETTQFADVSSKTVFEIG